MLTSSNLWICLMKKSPYRRATFVSAMWIMSCGGSQLWNSFKLYASQDTVNKLVQQTSWSKTIRFKSNKTEISGSLFILEIKNSTKTIYLMFTLYLFEINRFWIFKKTNFRMKAYFQKKIIKYISWNKYIVFVQFSIWYVKPGSAYHHILFCLWKTFGIEFKCVVE